MLGYNIPKFSQYVKKQGNFAAYLTVGVEGKRVFKDVFLEGVRAEDYDVEPKDYIGSIILATTIRIKDYQVQCESHVLSKRYKSQKKAHAYGVFHEYPG